MLKPALIGAFLAITAAGCAATPEYRLAESSVVTHCLATGTHIVSKDRNCPMPAGRSYSKEDIANSGAGSTAQALWKLDPAISLGGGHHR
jgi:hypothetical protein